MGKTAAMLLVLVLLVWSIAVIPLPVQAQVRTIVVPDDYATINAAIESASDGDTILVARALEVLTHLRICLSR